MLQPTLACSVPLQSLCAHCSLKMLGAAKCVRRGQCKVVLCQL